MKTTLLLFILFTQIAFDAKASDNRCLYEFLYSIKISREKFLDCKDQLMHDNANAEYIVEKLIYTFFSKPYRKFTHLTEALSFVRTDYNYYDFDSIPLIQHRYIAIREILRNHFKKNWVSTSFILDLIKQSHDYKLIRFILSNSRNEEHQYIEFINGLFFLNCYFISPAQNKLLRRSTANILMRTNALKYSQSIAQHIYKNHPEEITDYIHHVFTNRTIPLLPTDLKNKLVKILFIRLQDKPPYFAYKDVKAIEYLTGLDFRSEIMKQHNYSKETEKVHQLIQQKAIQYYKEHYKED